MTLHTPERALERATQFTGRFQTAARPIGSIVAVGLNYTAGRISESVPSFRKKSDKLKSRVV